jgi:hypothetical protein
MTTKATLVTLDIGGVSRLFNGKITEHFGRSLSRIAGSNPALGTIVSLSLL